MTPLGDGGEVQALLLSGMSAEETNQLRELWERLPHLGYLRDIPGPLRVPDQLAYLRSLGRPEPRGRLRHHLRLLVFGQKGGLARTAPSPRASLSVP